MQTDYSEKTDSISVGIFRNETSYYAQILPFPPSPAGSPCLDELGKNRGKVIYKRSFSEMPLALGFCHVINNVSKESVEKIISNHKK
ncbi:MAG: hypothetical protein LBS01_10645 [Prevotellaceae bacterium]|jgi:hypothetical protein|nr:hypothetical protein [Prevotellaceae bacterium]